MLSGILQNTYKKFLVTAGAAYFILYLIYQFVVKKYTFYDQEFIGFIINGADFILQAFGFKTFKVLQDRDFQVIGIDGSNGVWIGSNCNAIKLFGLFFVFVFAFPGKVKSKLWFIPLGIIIIHVLNIFRVVALACMAKFAPEYLDFNHTYTFTFLVYGVIFLLWMWWVNSFSEIKSKNE